MYRFARSRTDHVPYSNDGTPCTRPAMDASILLPTVVTCSPDGSSARTTAYTCRIRGNRTVGSDDGNAGNAVVAWECRVKRFFRGRACSRDVELSSCRRHVHRPLFDPCPMPGVHGADDKISLYALLAKSYVNPITFFYD